MINVYIYIYIYIYIYVEDSGYPEVLHPYDNIIECNVY